MKPRTLLKQGCFLVAVVFGASASAQDELPEVSSDGLSLLKNTEVAVAYALPGTTLDQYTRVMLVEAFVDFQEDWQKDYNLNEVGLQGRVTDKDAEEIKQRLADEFKAVFTEELEGAGHEVVETAGPDVLLLRPALINVDVEAPDLRSAARSQTYIRSAGQMTLYMELYDSSTSTLLARVVDPQADRGTGLARAANRGTNRIAADRILRDWAELLAGHLGDVSAQASESD